MLLTANSKAKGEVVNIENTQEVTILELETGEAYWVEAERML